MIPFQFKSVIQKGLGFDCISIKYTFFMNMVCLGYMSIPSAGDLSAW